jgi:hypothetical protein
MAVSPLEPTPLAIPSASNCILWMRPQDTRSSNMTTSAGRLSAIKNLANNRILINQTTAAYQPASGVATINGLNALQYDNDNNRRLSTNITNQANLTIFTVIQQFVIGVQAHVFAGTGTEQTIRLASNTGFTCNDGSTALSLVGDTSILTQPAILAVRANASLLTRNLYKNSATAGTSGVYDGNIGAQLFGANSTAASGARGGFNQGETIIYNKALSDSEIITIMRYLANQSGVILT